MTRTHASPAMPEARGVVANSLNPRAGVQGRAEAWFLGNGTRNLRGES